MNYCELHRTWHGKYSVGKDESLGEYPWYVKNERDIVMGTYATWQLALRGLQFDLWMAQHGMAHGVLWNQG